MSTLSGSFPKAAPGLPRGRTSLDRSDANAQQRARLLRAVISAVAEKGYQATSVADIVERARVSRTVMYREFDGKLDCFLAAIDDGRELIMKSVTEAMADVAEPSLETVLRAISRAYLERCAEEPDHTRAWMLELTAAGPRGVEVRDRYLDGFAALMKQIDCHYGGGRPRPDEHYIALVGGITELVRRQVLAETPSALPRLENALTEAAVAMLR
ncbi:MAG: TetR/AcrR family transcriptional regulator [Mycobacterium sp.]|nr:TetR/AcrR family transcriptional regulator [Mycobacterium sp.]